MPSKPYLDTLFQSIGYTPSPEQWAVHLSSARIRVVAGGERGGKSYSGANDLTGRIDWTGLGIGGERLYWLVAADYERTKPEFDYLCQNFDKLGVPFEASKRVDPGEIIVADGAIRIVTKSARDPRKLASEAPDGILGCESSQLTYEDFLRLRGRLAQKRAWLLMTGTFESSLGWYPEMYNRGQAPNEDGIVSFSLPTWSNLATFPGGRNDPEILALERASSYEWFMERYGGVPCPPKGLIFPEFKMSLHVGTGGLFDYDPALPVYLAVDPGYQHAYAVLAVQFRDQTAYVIDEIYERGLVTNEMVTVAKQRPWAGKVAGGAIDVAGTRHQAMAAPSEVWLKEFPVFLASQKVGIEDGIERLKSLFKPDPTTGHPKVFINAKCLGLISELGGCPSPITNQTNVYHYKVDKDNNVIGIEDKYNDAVKALIYLLVDRLGYTGRKKRAGIKFF
ncbi:MAG: hypothetical protein TUN42_04310 [Dehalogenimonas sp.]